MAARLRFVPGADDDIEHALRFTRSRFGETKYLEYADLIEDALEVIVANPRAGSRRTEIDPDAWIYPIKQPGRDARHLVLYRILADGAIVEVIGLPYDGRDLPALWRQR